MLASVMPAAMWLALACAIEVTGVTCTPAFAAPAVTLVIAAVIASLAPIAVVVPVASSV